MSFGCCWLAQIGSLLTLSRCSSPYYQVGARCDCGGWKHDLRHYLIFIFQVHKLEFSLKEWTIPGQNSKNHKGKKRAHPAARCDYIWSACTWSPLSHPPTSMSTFLMTGEKKWKHFEELCIESCPKRKERKKRGRHLKNKKKNPSRRKMWPWSVGTRSPISHPSNSISTFWWQLKKWKHSQSMLELSIKDCLKMKERRNQGQNSKNH